MSFFEKYGMPQSKADILKQQLTENSDTSAEYIRHYMNPGFERVCTIKSHWSDWVYEDINEDIMYAEHTSWVYMITKHGRIIKIGETGNLLGIKMGDGQPKVGSQCRLGRYRRGDQTDANIRGMYREETSQPGRVMEIYAFQCPIIEQEITVGNSIFTVDAQIHKQLEKTLLDYFKYNVGNYPEANTGRC